MVGSPGTFGAVITVGTIRNASGPNMAFNQGYISLEKFAGYLPTEEPGISLLDKLPLTSDYPKIDPVPVLQRRANSKLLALQLATALVDLGPTTLSHQYERGCNCSQVVQHTADRYRSSYCERRFCLVCNRIRTAKLINAYKPILDGLNNLHFLTLTIPNVPGYELKTACKSMVKAFQRIKDNMRKVYGLKIEGIRKLEITYNDVRRDYHPHYHIVISGQMAAETALNLWLNQFPEAKRSAQDVKKADENSVKELFKYFTKITTNNKTSKKLHITALNTIFNAIQGARIFQPFGIKMQKPVISEEEIANATYLAAQERQAIATGAVDLRPVDTKVYVWNQRAGNWLDVTRTPMIPVTIRWANRFFYRRFVVDESDLPNHHATQDLVGDPAPG
jgi:Replication protein